VGEGVNKSSAVPGHVAIIMDGNGRWAERQGLSRTYGHEVGAKRIEEIVQAASKLGVKYLTLYAFSRENWSRPPQEVDFLMNLLDRYLDRISQSIERENKEEKAVFNVIGRLEDLPEKLREKIVGIIDRTKDNPGLVLTLALSYSSRSEIVHAFQKISTQVLAGQLEPDQISEKTVDDHLYTSGLPNPELLIRTSGEMRVSNFLLWQIHYSEIYVTEKCWPEFTSEDFAAALHAYQKRERRFGQVSRTRAES
jgi:undecaprenyl diphosphate synthase